MDTKFRTIISMGSIKNKYLIALKVAFPYANNILHFLIRNYGLYLDELFTSPDRVLKSEHRSEKILEPLKKVNWGCVDLHLEWLSSQENRHVISPLHHNYPYPMRHHNSAPAILFAEGNINLLLNRKVGIVGSRNATLYGLKNAASFAMSLGVDGFCIVSGLARGIDTESHKHSLNTKGGTIAVIGTGLNVVYPSSNKFLSNEIRSHGLLLSEYLLDTKPNKFHFPQRNRIIAQLSEAVLIVEASENSGSLITARQALEYGVDVYAIPGDINQKTYVGSHNLIKQGAILVDTPSDISRDLVHRYGKQMIL